MANCANVEKTISFWLGWKFFCRDECSTPGPRDGSFPRIFILFTGTHLPALASNRFDIIVNICKFIRRHVIKYINKVLFRYVIILRGIGMR